MPVSAEDFEKMFKFVQEIHEKYTKALEQENEVLRNTLAATQQKLDELIAQAKKDSSIKSEFEKIREYMKAAPVQPYVCPTIAGTPVWISNPTIYTTGGTASPPLGFNGIATNANVKCDNSKSSSYDEIKKQFQSIMNGYSGDKDDN